MSSRKCPKVVMTFILLLLTQTLREEQARSIASEQCKGGYANKSSMVKAFLSNLISSPFFKNKGDACDNIQA